MPLHHGNIATSGSALPDQRGVAQPHAQAFAITASHTCCHNINALVRVSLHGCCRNRGLMTACRFPVVAQPRVMKASARAHADRYRMCTASTATCVHACAYHIIGFIQLYRALVLHGDGRISPATPMNQNHDQPSRGQLLKQCKPNETKTNSITMNPRKRHSNSTYSYTPSRVKYVGTSMTHVWRHAPGHQEAGPTVPALTNRSNPPRVWMQRDA